MLKFVTKLICLALLLILSGCGINKDKALKEGQWDCSVACDRMSSPDDYVITYTGEKVKSKSGTLIIQNRNDFEIVVHLIPLYEEEKEAEIEMISDSIPVGGEFSFQNVPDRDIVVGVHADVDVNTDIFLFIYDGECLPGQFQ